MSTLTKINLFFLACIIYSCAPTQFIKPLAKKEHAVNVAFGGPLIKFGNATIPIPFINANYGYGIDSALTGFSGINITSAMFGNVQLNVGITKQLLQQKNYIPAISITPVVNVIYRNKDAKKLYPQLAINAFWEYGTHKNLMYVGIDNWYELANKRGYEIEQPNHLIFMPTVGHSFNRKKTSINIETKIIAPNLSNRKLVVDYQTPFGTYGAFGVYIGITRKF